MGEIQLAPWGRESTSPVLPYWQEKYNKLLKYIVIFFKKVSLTSTHYIEVIIINTTSVHARTLSRDFQFANYVLLTSFTRRS